MLNPNCRSPNVKLAKESPGVRHGCCGIGAASSELTDEEKIPAEKPTKKNCGRHRCSPQLARTKARTAALAPAGNLLQREIISSSFAAGALIGASALRKLRFQPFPVGSNTTAGATLGVISAYIRSRQIVHRFELKSRLQTCFGGLCNAN
jgi:hypothetical protein